MEKSPEFKQLCTVQVSTKVTSEDDANDKGSLFHKVATGSGKFIVHWLKLHFHTQSFGI